MSINAPATSVPDSYSSLTTSVARLRERYPATVNGGLPLVDIVAMLAADLLAHPNPKESAFQR